MLLLLSRMLTLSIWKQLREGGTSCLHRDGLPPTLDCQSYSPFLLPRAPECSEKVKEGLRFSQSEVKFQSWNGKSLEPSATYLARDS